MRIVRLLAIGVTALSVIALLVPASVTLAASGGATATVGDFLSSYARVLKIDLPANADPSAVVASLKAIGVKLDASVDASKALTQADVVRIGKANGLRLTTQHPEAAFTPSEIDQFFTSYGFSLVPASSLANGGGADRAAASSSENTPGANKGKKKGHQSPTEPM